MTDPVYQFEMRLKKSNRPWLICDNTNAFWEFNTYKGLMQAEAVMRSQAGKNILNVFEEDEEVDFKKNVSALASSIKRAYKIVKTDGQNVLVEFDLKQHPEQVDWLVDKVIKRCERLKIIKVNPYSVVVQAQFQARKNIFWTQEFTVRFEITSDQLDSLFYLKLEEIFKNTNICIDVFVKRRKERIAQKYARENARKTRNRMKSSNLPGTVQ
jgi:hypothetical protein